MNDGYIVLRGAFSREKAAEWMKEMWTRLGMNPDDKTTWDKEKIHMPAHNREAVETFAPKVRSVQGHYQCNVELSANQLAVENVICAE